ncbi:hypothetical protein CYMTET_34208 [Cymbomonas tetramitiformis]|uniref:Aminotransferase class I/classII large domain-containing protein n=1 Tax=Cymbomonas tetramitiformis TaxID=36881 RepID=A0AAE0FC07_9CHLO|nr:hypothetical protein CYMTET_34208 [Cymbomonas tetramitiformis]
MRGINVAVACVCAASVAIYTARRRLKARQACIPVEIPRVGDSFAKKFSRLAHGRGGNQLKKLIGPFVTVPGVVHLAQGAPPSSVFPIAEVRLKLQSGDEVVVDDPGQIAAAQQYSVSGHPRLRAWCREWSAKTYAPPMADQDWDVTLTTGNTDSIDKLGSLLLDEGDVLLVEEYTYSTTLDGLAPYKPKMVPVEVDRDGLVPEALERACAGLVAAGTPPKALYIVPVGSNPLGTVLAPGRYAAIYAIAQRYDFIVWEDDPYIFLSYDSETGDHPLPATTFASLDTDGRVARLDSFAKFLGPGFRCAWITAPRTLIEKLDIASGTTTQNGSTFVHVTLHHLLTQWGDAGLRLHLQSLRQEYQRRRGVLLAAMDEHLTGLAKWTVPRAGMFVWVTLLRGSDDSADLMPDLLHHKVLIVPGKFFSPCGAGTPSARISFSSATDDQMQEGIRRLGKLLKDLPPSYVLMRGG